MSLVLGAVLIALAAIHARGTLALSRRSGMLRAVRMLEAGCFIAGLAVLAAALLTPLEELAARSLTAHMVQHMLLMIGAAPLLVLGRPQAALLLGLPLNWRRPVAAAAGGFVRIRRPVRAVAVAAAVQALTLWAWHAPALYDAALAVPVVHDLEHATMLAAAMWFWHALARAGRTREGVGAAILCALLTLMHSGMLGGLLTFAQAPIYAAYRDAEPSGELSALADQQLAGLIMWVPAGLAYLAAGLTLVGRLLDAPDRDANPDIV